jgi:Na+/proline symporter
MLTLTAPAAIGGAFIVMLTINGLVGIVAQPHMIAAVGTGKDELTCRVGNLYGNLIKRVCTIGWALVGLIAAAMVVKGVAGVTHLDDPEDAFGFACRHLLFPGGVGLLVACFLAANMGSCAAFTVNSGALVTHGLYRKYFKPDASDQHYLWVGRLSGTAVTLAAVGYALFLIERVLYSFLLTETLATYFGISIFAGIVWRRANRWGAIASIIAAFAVNFSVYAARGQRLDSWNPWVFLAALVTGVIVLAVVSWLTPPEPVAATERYYGNLATPTDFADEAAARDPRAVAAAGRQLLVTNLLHPRQGAHGQPFFRAYRADLTGFAIGVAAVVALVVVFWLFVRA